MMTEKLPTGPRVAIVGAGVIGMCSALALSDRGARVTLFDSQEPGRGASWAAAGMLAPAYEAAAEKNVHPKLFDLCMASADMWPAFAERLRGWTDRTLDYGQGGALACAATAEQGDMLMALAEACEARGVPHNRLEHADAVKLEPSLSSEVMGALELPTDQQIDNWAVVEALRHGLERAGVTVHAGRSVTAIEGEAGNLRFDNLPGEVFDAVLWATGERARKPVLFNGDPCAFAPKGAVQPVKGQMFSLAPGAGSPRRVLRFGMGYVAPKPSRIVVGATVEWGVDDRQTELDVIEDLRQQAAQICPALSDGAFTHIWAGVRPGAPDHAPLIGPTQHSGVYLATGHYRNGILLAPITGAIAADMLIDGQVSQLAEAFSPARFNS